MTREEAKSMWINNVGGKAQYLSIIDCIYNDFESRTCESCKWYGNLGWCDKLCVPNDDGSAGKIKPFGYEGFRYCSEWEAKDEHI